MKKFFPILIIMFLISACASLTPLKDLKESDLSWEEKTIPAGYQEVHRRITQGFRDCDWQNLYFLEANLYTDIKRAEFIVYSNGAFFGIGKAQGPYVIGKISANFSDDSRTDLRAGVIHFWAKSPSENKTRASDWIRMAEGDYSWCGEK